MMSNFLLKFFARPDVLAMSEQNSLIIKGQANRTVIIHCQAFINIEM